MENVVIGNATYLVNRFFVGERKVTDLIQKRIENNCSQLLTLKYSMPASYNNSVRNTGSGRNHAN